MAKKTKNKAFRTEIYFVGGKMKKRRIPLIDGLEVEEFVRRNADDGFLLREGYYHILHEREEKRKTAQPGATDNPGHAELNLRSLFQFARTQPGV